MSKNGECNVSRVRRLFVREQVTVSDGACRASEISKSGDESLALQIARRRPLLNYLPQAIGQSSLRGPSAAAGGGLLVTLTSLFPAAAFNCSALRVSWADWSQGTR